MKRPMDDSRSGISTVAAYAARQADKFDTHDARLKCGEKARARTDGERLDVAGSRLKISSCCLTRTDSATTARAPPGPASRATVVRKVTNGLQVAQVHPSLRLGEIQEMLRD